MQLSDWLKRTIVRDILANGYRKNKLKLTKFVLRVLFQSSSSRTAALLQTTSSLPHKERILEKASLIIIIIIIIIKFSMHTVECKVIITWHSHIIIYSNLLLLLLICYYCLLLLLLLLLLFKSVKLQFYSPMFILSVLSAHTLIVRHELLNLTVSSTVLYRAMDYIPFRGRESSNNFREIDVSRNWNGPENLLKDLDINQSGQYAVFNTINWFTF